MNVSGFRRTKSEGSICTIRMLISYDDRILLTNQDVESILLSNLSHSMGTQTPAGVHRASHNGACRQSSNRHNFFGSMMSHKSSVGHNNDSINPHQQNSVNKMEEFSGHVALTTHHTGLLLSLPSIQINNRVLRSDKSVHFLVGKQEDYETSLHLVRKRKRSRMFQRHSVNGTTSKINLHEISSKPNGDEDIKMDFQLRRSLSLGWLTNNQSKHMDVVFQHAENHGIGVGKKAFRRRMRRVARGFNLTDMHWISHKHSTSSGPSLKSTSNYEATSGGEVTLVSSSLKIQTDVSL